MQSPRYRPGHPRYAPFTGIRPGIIRGRFHGLGALGAATAPITATTIAKTAGTTAASVGAGAGAAAIATAAGYGSIAGPVGTVVGAIVGLVAGDLLAKNYLNVAQMNAAEDNEVAAFNQYKSIQGRVAGRTIGLAAMTAVWKGALHSGYFPLNNQTQCFHEGCSKYPGNASLIDDAINASAQYATFSLAMAQMKAARPLSSGTAVPRIGPATGQLTVPKADLAGPRFGRLPPVHPGAMRRGRLGVLGAAAAPVVPQAVTFIDSYFIPDNQKMSSPPWAVPQVPLEHQILYDVADAYLAANVASFGTTTPYIAMNAAPIAAPQPALVAAGSTTVTPARVASAGGGTVPAVSQTAIAVTPVASPALAPVVTAPLPATPAAIASAAGTSTTVAAATSANLNAALAAQGYVAVGTTAQGFPLYSQAGQVYVYSNGELSPYGTVAQTAVTGGAGDGIATPATGIDPGTLSLINNALAQGATPAQAVAAAVANLQAQGVTVTPDIQAQLNAAAYGPPAVGSSFPWLLVIGGVGLFLLLR
jgi:hypothetical protein